MPHPTDPNPYATIASKLLAARDGRAPSTDTARSKAALRSFLQQHSPSARSTDAAAMRVATAKAERFADTHRDYATSNPHVAPGFTTPNTDNIRGR